MEKANTKRRNFMLTLGLGGLAAAAALLVGKESRAAQPEEAALQAPVKKGYRVSEHVKRYYRSTRI